MPIPFLEFVMPNVETHFASQFVAKSATTFFENGIRSNTAVFTFVLTSLESEASAIETTAGYKRFIQLRLERYFFHIQVSYRILEYTPQHASEIRRGVVDKQWRKFFKLSNTTLWPDKASHLSKELKKMLPRKALLPDGQIPVSVLLGLDPLLPDFMVESCSQQNNVA